MNASGKTDIQDTGAVCVICAHTFNIVTVPQEERILRRRNLVELCKLLGANTTDERRNFLNLEGMLMSNPGVTLCVECYSTVATAMRAQEEQKGTTAVMEFQQQQFALVFGQHEARRRIYFGGMMAVANKIEATEGSASIENFGRLHGGKTVAMVRKQITEVIRDLCGENEDAIEQPKGQNGVGALSAGEMIIVDCNPVMNTRKESIAGPLAILAPPGVSGEDQDIRTAGTSASRFSFRKRSPDEGQDNDDDDFKSPAKKLKSSLPEQLEVINPPATPQRTMSDFKMGIVQRAAKRAEKDSSISDVEETGTGPQPNIWYCQTTDRLFIGNAEIRINEDLRRLECTTCNFASNQPQVSTTKSGKIRNTDTEVEKKMKAHILSRHMNIYKMHCEHCHKGFNKRRDMDNHVAKEHPEYKIGTSDQGGNDSGQKNAVKPETTPEMDKEDEDVEMKPASQASQSRMED